jgi:hypothetical protein
MVDGAESRSFCGASRTGIMKSGGERMIHYRSPGFVNTRVMFTVAVRARFAVPAYNFNNMEQLQAIILTSLENRPPVIIQVSKGARDYADRTILGHMAHGAVEMMKREVARSAVCKINIDSDGRLVMTANIRLINRHHFDLTFAASHCIRHPLLSGGMQTKSRCPCGRTSDRFSGMD